MAWAWLIFVATVVMGTLVIFAAVSAYHDPWAALYFVSSYTVLVITWRCIMRVIRTD